MKFVNVYLKIGVPKNKIKSFKNIYEGVHV